MPKRLQALSERDFRRLREWLEPDDGLHARFPFVACEGFLTGIVSCAKPVPKAEWLGEILSAEGAPARPDDPDTSSIVSLLERWHDEIATDLRESPEAFSPHIADEDNEINPAAAMLFARGYFDAVRFRIDDWEPFFKSDSVGLLVPIVDLVESAPGPGKRFDAKKAARAASRLLDSVADIYRYSHDSPERSARSAATTVHRLKITLRDVKPVVWRRVEILSDAKLPTVSRVLLAAMGWEDRHLHEFVGGDVHFGTEDPDFPRGVRSERNRTLAEIAPEKGDSFEFEYDFGDGWSHRVLVENVAATEVTVTYPRCIGGRRACPAEDCGGPPGYDDLIEALADPEHPEHAELSTWVGSSFDPSAFDPLAVDRDLARFRRTLRAARKPTQHRPKGGHDTGLQQRPSAQERETLEAMLERHNPNGYVAGSSTRLHGFLTSVVSGPMLLPSEWLRAVLGDDENNAWDSIDETQRSTTLLMRFHNEIAGDLRAKTDSYGILIDRIGDPEGALQRADDWCKGYLAGVALREHEWKEAMEDPALRPFFDTLRSLESLDPLKEPVPYRVALDELPGGALAVADWWLRRLVHSMEGAAPVHFGTVRRATPKISPNAPCTCGSGKKYKRCCSPVRAV